MKTITKFNRIIQELLGSKSIYKLINRIIFSFRLGEEIGNGSFGRVY